MYCSTDETLETRGESRREDDGAAKQGGGDDEKSDLFSVLSGDVFATLMAQVHPLSAMLLGCTARNLQAATMIQLTALTALDLSVGNSIYLDSDAGVNRPQGKPITSAWLNKLLPRLPSLTSLHLTGRELSASAPGCNFGAELNSSWSLLSHLTALNLDRCALLPGTKWSSTFAHGLRCQVLTQITWR